jgi:hypothetical protein
MPGGWGSGVDALSRITGSFDVISRARFVEIKEKPTVSLDAYECVSQASVTDDRLHDWVAALRKAGLPQESVK